MPIELGDRLRHAWNAFTNKDPTYSYGQASEVSYYRPDRPRFTRGNERSIVTSVYNRIAMDVASLTINHVRLDDNGRFTEVIDSGLNRCLTLNAGAIALELGNAKCMNVVLFGAMTRALGMDDIDWEAVIRRTVPAASLELNLRAYRAGREAVG